ncbi:MAG: protein of unknown function DUF4407/DUF4407 [Verrucomicrobia bacterium]|nr:MAG: protein of unknown function DUF4407/DUF4407 [Verrucomicrobiota bacterium]
MDLNLGAWLAGAGPSSLRNCSDSERRKVCAIGYTVLVPTIFALISASYAVSTLTHNPVIITLIAIAWAAIILIVDRAIISSYSPFMKSASKIAVVTLRITVAVLMGLTVSHPLTLLLFKDTITAQIEAGRAQEVEALHQTFQDRRAVLDARLAAASAEQDKQRKARDESYEAKFIRPTQAADSSPVQIGLTAAEELDLKNRTEAAVAGLKGELASLVADIEAKTAKKSQLEKEITHWQSEFEAEINGKRSGLAGSGPRSKSIEKDQLDWRRKENAQFATDLSALDLRKTDLEKKISAVSGKLREEANQAAMERAAKAIADAKRVDGLIAETQAIQLQEFLKSQEARRDQIDAAIATAQNNLDSISKELTALANEETEALKALQTAPRKDLLAQTLALHHLFSDPAAGGRFAQLAYLILAGLFLAVDTMPILVKFTSKTSEYDIRQAQSLSEVDNGILKNIPSEMGQFDENQSEELQNRVFTFYQRELDRKLEEQAQSRVKSTPPSVAQGPTPSGSSPAS